MKPRNYVLQKIWFITVLFVFALTASPVLADSSDSDDSDLSMDLRPEFVKKIQAKVESWKEKAVEVGDSIKEKYTNFVNKSNETRDSIRQKLGIDNDTTAAVAPPKPGAPAVVERVDPPRSEPYNPKVDVVHTPIPIPDEAKLACDRTYSKDSNRSACYSAFREGGFTRGYDTRLGDFNTTGAPQDMMEAETYCNTPNGRGSGYTSEDKAFPENCLNIYRTKFGVESQEPAVAPPGSASSPQEEMDQNTSFAKSSFDEFEGSPEQNISDTKSSFDELEGEPEEDMANAKSSFDDLRQEPPSDTATVTSSDATPTGPDSSIQDYLAAKEEKERIHQAELARQRAEEAERARQVAAERERQQAEIDAASYVYSDSDYDSDYDSDAETVDALIGIFSGVIGAVNERKAAKRTYNPPPTSYSAPASSSNNSPRSGESDSSPGGGVKCTECGRLSR